jgi:hypothetical protein
LFLPRAVQENGNVEPARSELSVRADVSGKQRLGLSTPTPAYEQMRKQRLGLMIPTKTKAGAIDPHASLRANEKTKAGANDPHASLRANEKTKAGARVRGVACVFRTRRGGVGSGRMSMYCFVQ